MASYLDTKIEFLKGVGPVKSKLLQSELGVFTFKDLLYHFPFRHENRSKFHKINSLHLLDDENVQIIGTVSSLKIIGQVKKQRLSVTLKDETGSIELVWFKGVAWQAEKLKIGMNYLVYGKPSKFQNSYSISHPEIELHTTTSDRKNNFIPIYPTTDKLKKRYIDSKNLSSHVKNILDHTSYQIDETIDESIRDQYELISISNAIRQLHFPESEAEINQAIYRLKFDELFFLQLRLFQEKNLRKEKHQGILFKKSHLVKDFYDNYLAFELTNAQKRVIKEIYADMQSGYQMNRLLQGDVGSGKTITAFVCMLIAISSGFQTAIMAPTEILATQHLVGLKELCDKLGIRIALITGSTKKSNRKKDLESLINGEIQILVGTHALLENDIQFQKLGLVVIDEQHRFGVAQRAKLWKKNQHRFPHILVMTATPIPRTLAMTLYGDLELSIIDELPKGRIPIKTIHLMDESRSKLFGFIRKQIDIGRQVYIVYPLIEESETLSYKDLMDGYESITRAFPKNAISILHGKMKPKDKDFEMTRFSKGETQIMVATTVIEVGVNVPNTSVMVIENSERFGLSQLHQLRGRVGRGVEQSYCILMSGPKLSKEAKERIASMVATNDGFKIAEKDLEIRGPGDLMGTQQSGLLELKMADLNTDSDLLVEVRHFAKKIFEQDPELIQENHQVIKSQLIHRLQKLTWGNIS